MEITSISRYKGSTFEVELDGERKLYLHIDIIADNGLKKGSQLDKTELRKIIYDSNFRRAYQYALYCLDYRDYSERDMLRKLIGTYKNEDLCRAVVGKLAGAGVIDDARYAEKLARRLVEGRRYGFRRAKKELLLKGIEMLFRHAAVLQNFFDRLAVNHQRFGNLALLVHLDQIAELFVHSLYDLHAAFLFQRAGQHSFKAAPLFHGGPGRFRLKNCADKFLVCVVIAAGIA